MTGAFITVEGGDGAGKTTQLDFIESHLHRAGITVRRTREPGGTELGEALREILLSGAEFEISDDAELLMIFAAREQHLKQIIQPSLEKGEWVLCDRFTDATFAYQGGGRGIADSRIAVLEEWVQQGFAPDLTILLDVPLEVAQQRTAQRGQAVDRFESQNDAFKRAVRESYLSIARAAPQRVRVVDASESIESIQDRLSALLREFIEHFRKEAG